ncbi:hypothetical protein WDU94_009908 [Cyamophila willieti]
MAFLSSTPILVALAIFFHSSPFSNAGGPPPPPPAEHPELLPPKTLDICTENNTKVCPPTDKPNVTDPVCVKFGQIAGGNDTRCDEDNACSFMLKVNNVDKLVYVSLGAKSQSAVPDSTTYKTCANKLVIYSMYPPSK